MIKRLIALAVTFAFTVPAMAATLQLDFDYDFSDPLDLGSQVPDGPSPWATAVFTDVGVDTVNLTFTVGANEVTAVYLNSNVGGLSFTTLDDSAVSGSTITYASNNYQAGSDGEFDILIDLPPPGGNRLTAGESVYYQITASGLTANSFNSWSNPTEESVTGPFMGAAKFQSTGLEGEQSAWIAAVPVPAAVWLFGSALAGLGFMKRRKMA
jgi:hypothetical protein